MNQVNSRPLAYMPQLDALRALAVMLVTFSHWLPDSPINLLPNAVMGVTLFFVLSGYLISKILLLARLDAEEQQVSGGRVLRQFYLRRFLRIFPVYYFCLLLLYIGNVQGFRDHAWWFFSYLSNHYYFQLQDWQGVYAHLWTLAVEEQFYLFWPFVMLFLPFRWLRTAIWLTIAVGPVFRAVIFLIGTSGGATNELGHILMPGVMDSFALGALLAYHQLEHPERLLFTGKVSQIILGASLVGFVALAFQAGGFSQLIFFRFFFSVLALALIERAAHGFRGPMATILENPRLVWLGKISYGLYLFHNFVPWLFGGFTGVLRRSGIEIYLREINPHLLYPVYAISLILIAAISWRLIERPINAFKRFFPYI